MGGTSSRSCCTCPSALDADMRPLLAEQDALELAPSQPKPMAGQSEIPLSVIQFTCATYFCQEDERDMQIDIVRFGDCSGSALCDYTTRDASAKAGAHYEAQAGRLTFEPGETLKSIKVKIFDDDSFSSALEFKLLITNVEGAHSGKYLYAARVKIIDNDVWPTNRFQDEILRGNLEEIPGRLLMIEFFKFLLGDAQVFRDTVKIILLDNFKNLYFFLTLYLQLYMVDVVVKAEVEGEGEFVEERRLAEEEGGFSFVPEVLLVPGDRQRTAIIVGIAYFLPFFLTQVIDQYKCSLSVPGGARKLVQRNIMHKFLNCREEMRIHIKQSELTMSLIRDCVEVVDLGFVKALEVIRILGKLSLALIFILAENRLATLPLMVYPVVLAIWFECREKRTTGAIEERATTQDMMVSKVDDISTNIRLISDYGQKERAADDFAQTIQDFVTEEQIASSVVCTNVFVAPWLTVMFVGTFMALGASMVQGVGDGLIFGYEVGTISLGAFLATINVFKEVGAELEEIFKELLEIQMAFGPLKAITRLVNLESDLLTRRSINRKRRQEGRERRESARQQAQQKAALTGSEAAGFIVDTVDITIKNLAYGYKVGRFTGNRNSVILNMTQAFHQGQLHAFVGPPRQGKATLLRLLGQVVLPEDGSGDIFVPPHLRILHVAKEPHALNTTFLNNLLMGETLVRAGGMARVRRICERVGFVRETLDILLAQKEDEDDLVWTSRFSSTDYARLSLARVFINNPELLAIHHPAMLFDEQERPTVISLLKEHVENKGLELYNPSDKAIMRPRTVFFSSSFIEGLESADRCYVVNARMGLQEKPLSELRRSMVLDTASET
eukprot:gb/GFBE01074050.1/.p1 GENE.gb/GFBE01074050.1/~~gb/GFBE01074050.1/.p1  ORF type:complete len:841 (+),score=180.18 gb/GFBE01074050.1/:1-2523(+)